MGIEALSDLVILRVHSVSTLYTPKNTGTKRSDRPSWAIVLKYEGETVYHTNGGRVVSDLQHIAVLPRGCTYEWECTQSGHYTIIEFEAEKTYPAPFALPVKHGEKIVKMCKELEYKRTLGGPMVGAESIRDVYSLLLAVAAPSLDKYIPDSKRQRLRPAIEYISQNLGSPIRNDALAALLGVSTVYFRKLFTEVMGQSPITYTKQLRIEKAKEMLGSDYGTLTDIAQSLGYSGLYDFSRDFKKHVGVAPSKYILPQ